MKKAYNTPNLTVHGNVESLTQQTLSGSKSDKVQPAGTPLTELVQNIS